MKALLLRRAGCSHSDRAEVFLRSRSTVTPVSSDGPGTELDPALLDDPPDVLFAFRSRIIVKKPFLDAIPLCINFHPGPPERRGSGCVNFALMEGDSSYGCTCHFIDEQIDHGPIIDVRRFPVVDQDGVADVLARTHEVMLRQFFDIAGAVAEGRDPGLSGDEWQGPVGTIKQMNTLREISLQASPEAMERQIRATSCCPHQPYVKLHGRRFVLERTESGAG